MTYCYNKSNEIRKEQYLLIEGVFIMKRKLIAQLIGILIGLIIFMFGMLTSFPTIIFSSVGIGIICFNILVSSFQNIDYHSMNFFLPLLFLTGGIVLMFLGFLTPMCIIKCESVGVISFMISIIFMVRSNRIQ